MTIIITQEALINDMKKSLDESEKVIKWVQLFLFIIFIITIIIIIIYEVYYSDV